MLLLNNDYKRKSEEKKIQHQQSRIKSKKKTLRHIALYTKISISLLYTHKTWFHSLYSKRLRDTSAYTTHMHECMRAWTFNLCFCRKFYNSIHLIRYCLHWKSNGQTQKGVRHREICSFDIFFSRINESNQDVILSSPPTFSIAFVFFLLFKTEIFFVFMREIGRKRIEGETER